MKFQGYRVVDVLWHAMALALQSRKSQFLCWKGREEDWQKWRRKGSMPCIIITRMTGTASSSSLCAGTMVCVGVLATRQQYIHTFNYILMMGWWTCVEWNEGNNQASNDDECGENGGGGRRHNIHRLLLVGWTHMEMWRARMNGLNEWEEGRSCHRFGHKFGMNVLENVVMHISRLLYSDWSFLLMHKSTNASEEKWSRVELILKVWASSWWGWKAKLALTGTL